MRLATYGPAGGEQPAVFVDDATILPLRPVLDRAGVGVDDVCDLLALWPAVESLVRAALERGDGEPLAVGDVRLGPPVPRPGKVVAIGFNYAQHGDGILPAEPPPGEPIVFLKPPTCVCGPNDPLVRPPETDQLDYEVELGVVIGRAGRRIDRDAALAHVAGYLVANDVTARDVAIGAMHHSPLLAQIARGKGFPTFCPTGPWLATPDEVDGSELRLRLSVNGQPRQDARTSQMVVDVAGLIASVSATMELRPGDLILTGTPPGCGFQLDPPAYLAAGDRVRASITGLGEIDQVVVDEALAPTA